MKFTLEICVGSLSSGIAAQEGGADRIELCANLAEGGTTPSFGTIKTCKTLLDIPVFAIIRPRGGDFVYSHNEFQSMKQDVLTCLEYGCDGIVFGILLPNGNIDTKRCAELVSVSDNMQLTFHRAFDRCIDRERGLEDLIDLGFNRVLTSGGMEYAGDSLPELKRLVIQGSNRISIMPGSGITEDNLLRIARETGASEFHSTAKTKTHGDSNGERSYQGGTYPYKTDSCKVTAMRYILDSF